MTKPRQHGAGELASAHDELLRIEGLCKSFEVKSGILTRGGSVQAVDDASLSVGRGEVLALVGESGSGKSTTGKLILGLERPSAGGILFEGVEISSVVKHRSKDLQRRIQVVFQNPNSSLDPLQRVGDIIAEPLEVHDMGTRAERRDRVGELLEQVGLRREHADRYPFEFSGGQRQRIAIARALAPRPDFIVCDEPLTALDVSVQAQVLNVLQEIQRRDGLSYLFIAHDLSVVRQIADRVAVMYFGHIVEIADAERFFTGPHHPYSMALMSAMSIADPDVERTRERIILRGDMPSPFNPPTGCPFHTRCWKAQDICGETPPVMYEISPGRSVACHFPANVEDNDAAVLDIRKSEAALAEGGL